MAIGAGEANGFVRVMPGAEEPEMQLLFVNFAPSTILGADATSPA